LAAILGLFVVYFLDQAAFFFLDFTPSLLGAGLDTGMLLSFPIGGVILGVLFLGLAVYFGMYAIRIFKAVPSAVKRVGRVYMQLFVLCVLYLFLYYTVVRPQVHGFDSSAELPLFPWITILATATVAGGFLYSRRLESE